MNEEPSRKKLKWWGRICLKFTLFPWQCDSIHELHTELNFVVVWALFWGGKRVRGKGKIYSNFFNIFFSCACRCSVVASGWRRELKYFFQTHTADLKSTPLFPPPPISFLLLILFNIFSHLTLSSSSSSSESFVSWESGKWELHDEMSKSGMRKRKTLMWNKSTFNLKWQTQRRGEERARGRKTFACSWWGWKGSGTFNQVIKIT